VAATAFSASPLEKLSETQLLGKFNQFMSNFGKKYETPELQALRFQIFKDNVARAAQMNEAEGSEVFGITKFSDLTKEEFRTQYLSYKPKFGQAAIDRTHMPVAVPRSADPNTTSFDWRANGAVTAVKDQGQCGSCWAFSAVEELESAWFLGGHPMTELSPQQVVSCDKKGMDQGCNGGDTVEAYKYMKSAGLETEKDYPYTSGDSGMDGQCKYSASKVVAKMVNFTYATPPCFDACKKQDEDTLAKNLATTAPVSICVEAEPWQLYSGGILSKNCAQAYTSLDHCVQLVGFNTNTQGVKYWLIRNSWNTDWGMDGYIFVKYGSNLCGVADEATFIQV